MKSNDEIKLGEAGPLDAQKQPVLPRALELIVLEYLACDAGGDNQYSEKQLAAFKLFGTPIALNSKIARYIASGEKTKALEFIRKYPSTLHCVAEARDGFGMGRRAAGTPLRLAIAMGDIVLRDEIIKLLPAKEAKAQIKAHFSAGWEEEQKERDARYINAATRFRDQQLQAKRLANNLPWAQALGERKEIMDEYRVALRPQPDDPITTRGFMVNPQIYLTVHNLFKDSEASLGGYGSLDMDFLWGVGFQSLLGAGPPALGHILIGGANEYGNPNYTPPEALAFKDGTPFYDPDPLSGLGSTFVVSFWGRKYEFLMGNGVAWARVVGFRDRGEGRGRFWKAYAEQQHQYGQAYAASGQTDDNGAGTLVKLGCKS